MGEDTLGVDLANPPGQHVEQAYGIEEQELLEAQVKQLKEGNPQMRNLFVSMLQNLRLDVLRKDLGKIMKITASKASINPTNLRKKILQT